MPRKTKETNEEIIESQSKTAKKATKSTAKKTAAKKETKTTTKKAAAKKETKTTTKKAAVKKETKTTTKKAVAKKETKATTKKAAAKKETKATTKKAVKDEAKNTTSKVKTATKKATTKATSKSATKAKSTTKATKTAKAKTTKTKKSKIVAPSVVEYYDLPYKYNQTVVKVLYQNPTTLFVYWEISDDDIENYKSTYGDNFFETTKPVLVIYNETMNYKFEIDINDFANCWYFNINDSKCDYRLELIRKPISYNEKITTEYIYITSSNKIESPNDKILFSTNEPYTVYFKNVKNNNIRKVNLPRLLEKLNLINTSFGFPIVRNIYDLYTNVYKIEDVGDHSIGLTNPSSGNPSSHSNFATRFI